jgi:hypothetical protein
MDIDRPELANALRMRARAAITEAEVTVERAQTLVASRRIVADDEALATRCAWCGRLELGEQWLLPIDAPLFVGAGLHDRTTHGICSDCVARLERSGKSHRRPAH